MLSDTITGDREFLLHNGWNCDQEKIVLDTGLELREGLQSCGVC